MNLINAATLKEQIPETSVDIFENCRNCSLLDKDQILEIIDAAPTIEVEEPAQWIPITEALPKTDDMVLVTCVTKSGLKSVNRAYCDEHGFWHGSGSMAGVVAWLPLPKPYEGV